MQRQTTRVGDLAAAYLRLGPESGLPVVVLHGAGLDRAGASWRRSLPAIAERHPVIAPDLPGHGVSAPLPGAHRVPDFGGWFIALLDALRVERAVLTGVSLGGAVALWAALTAPDRVAGVVPVAAYGLARRAPLHPLGFVGSRFPFNRATYPLVGRSDRAARLALGTIIHEPACTTPELLAEVRQIATATPAGRSFDRFLRDEIGPGRFHTCLLPDLPSLAPPALFIHGVHDLSVPIEDARTAARAADAPLIELPAGHWPMWETPDPFNSALLDFLDRIEG